MKKLEPGSSRLRDTPWTAAFVLLLVVTMVGRAGAVEVVAGDIATASWGDTRTSDPDDV